MVQLRIVRRFEIQMVIFDTLAKNQNHPEWILYKDKPLRCQSNKEKMGKKSKILYIFDIIYLLLSPNFVDLALPVPRLTQQQKIDLRELASF